MRKGNTILVGIHTKYDLRDALKIEVLFGQKGRLILTKTGEDVYAEEEYVYVLLKKEETELFEAGRLIPVEITGIYEDDTQLTSNLMYRPFDGNVRIGPETSRRLRAHRPRRRREERKEEPVKPPVHIDTTEHWNAQPRLIGEEGHIYVYTDYGMADGQMVPAIKIGDGSAFLIDLPFVEGNDTDFRMHVNDEIRHVTDEERAFWNDKVTCFLSQGDSETVVFSKGVIANG